MVVARDAMRGDAKAVREVMRHAAEVIAEDDMAAGALFCTQLHCCFTLLRVMAAKCNSYCSRVATAGPRSANSSAVRLRHAPLVATPVFSTRLIMCAAKACAAEKGVPDAPKHIGTATLGAF